MKEENTEFFKVSLAGINIEIECNFRYTFFRCRDYLACFTEPDFVVGATKDELVAGRVSIPSKLMDIPDTAICYADFSTELNIIYRKIAQKVPYYNAFLMHGAVVSTEGQAYIFTAPSGVGKSTRARIWLDEYPGSFIVNGDKPLIKMADNEVLACGTPWCGSEGWNTNIIVPLRAIFLLERANDGESSTIEEVSLGEAFPFLLQQTYRPSEPDLMRKTIQLLKGLEGKVKIYKFRSTPTNEAIRLAYETARPR